MSAIVCAGGTGRRLKRIFMSRSPSLFLQPCPSGPKHSGGEWVSASDLEFIKDNKAIVYSAKSGHASFPHPGNYLQGSEKLGIGVRNDAARSKFSLDSSDRYQIVAAEYLVDVVTEPSWLQFMREWGPTFTYNSRSDLDKMISFLPVNLWFSVESIFYKLSMEKVTKDAKLSIFQIGDLR